MRSVIVAATLIFAGVLSAQTRIETQTITKSNWNGTLVDANCQRTHTERKETDSRVTTTTRTETIECPVTTETRSFGLLTSDGRFLRFDDSSNSRVVEIVRGNHDLRQVRVVGSVNGDVAVVESISPDGSTTVTGEDVIFDVQHGGDRGKLVVTARGINYENLSEAKHSERFAYSDIKELKREGSNKIEIHPFSGHDLEFRVEGAGMSETVYKMIGDRIAAARSR